MTRIQRRTLTQMSPLNWIEGKNRKVLNGKLETCKCQRQRERKGISIYSQLSHRKYDCCRLVQIQWTHLKNIDFQRCAASPIVDILIGIDCADLHYAFIEMRGRPWEPFARLTPLGWTCIGNPGQIYTRI